MKNEVETLRTAIQNIDAQIETLLEERSSLVSRIAPFKEKQDIPVFLPEYEARILEQRNTRYCYAWQEIFSVAKQLQGFTCYVHSFEDAFYARYCLGKTTTILLLTNQDSLHTIMDNNTPQNSKNLPKNAQKICFFLPSCKNQNALEITLHCLCSYLFYQKQNLWRSYTCYVPYSVDTPHTYAFQII